ncbi:VOC family protein [Paractinoplanes durhamensis]|uniref:2,3-dihydroxybiphenyl 1,2-dioxygenase n=1 Tax=Paractinoplanes durhamensis TaxID=113563 RepID=A0ABQ3YRD2_9ACTN|nr:VOC family protein [Actinoplanes durhamensis]GIE00150.1 2,3-dihydroxybiphenyl 1,2-dioxygenase [Actinoplanes durhamensis]
MTADRTVDTHRGLHSELGGRRHEHPGRAKEPVIKVVALAWLEFVKPDLDRAEKFATDFGFQVAERSPDVLKLRGTWSAAPCLVIRRGPRPGFVGPVFLAESVADVERLARRTGGTATATAGGTAVRLRDPSGLPVQVVAGLAPLAAVPERAHHEFNFGAEPVRVNATQRTPAGPAQVQKLGHVVLETTRFRATLDWYLENLGMIVSDFLYLDGLRDRGPTMAFIRCDLGSVPSDHHTLAMHLGMRNGYVHSAYQLTDLDEVAIGGEFLRDRGYRRVWGIGRHIQGSQIFDYWHDPDRMMFEHYADGDVFDCTVEPGWATMNASGLSQWGPPVSRDFLGSKPSPALARALITALADGGNEFDLDVARALMKAMSA